MTPEIKYECKTIPIQKDYGPDVIGRSLLNRNEKKLNKNHTILDFLKELNTQKKVDCSRN